MILHDVATGQVLRRLSGNTPITSLTFSADGQRLMTVAKEDIRIWNVTDGKSLRLPANLAAGALSPDRKTIACPEGSNIQLWEINSDPEGIIGSPYIGFTALQS